MEIKQDKKNVGNKLELLQSTTKTKCDSLWAQLKQMIVQITDHHDSMGMRVQNLMKRIVEINKKLDGISKNNQKFALKIREKIEALDSQHILLTREIDEIRKKILSARKKSKKHGFIRTFFTWVRTTTAWILVKLNIRKPSDSLRLQLEGKKPKRNKSKSSIELNDSNFPCVDIKKSLINANSIKKNVKSKSRKRREKKSNNSLTSTATE